jgi:hypothetical protein
MVACLGGTFQFGYTFYVYNQLVTAVGNGGRYAAMRTYRASGSTDIEKGKEAIRNMAVHQRGVTLTDAQVKSIEIWMDSLTGQIPISYIKPPELPKSTSQPPQPSGE